MTGNPHIHTIQHLPLHQVVPDPNQPRKRFDPEQLQELANSIAEHGVIQPITVRPSAPRDPAQGELGEGAISELRPAIIIAGERRHRACKLAGVETIPVIVRSDLSDGDIAVIQVIENLQRENLSLPEYCAGVTKLVDVIGLPDAARRLGKSKTWVSRRSAVSAMPAEIRQLVIDGIVRDIEIAHDLVKLQDMDKRSFGQVVKEFREPLEHRNGPPNRAAVRRALEYAKQQAEWKAADLQRAEQRKADPGAQTAHEQRKAEEKARKDREKLIPQLREEIAATEKTLQAELDAAIPCDADHFRSSVRGPYLHAYNAIPKDAETAKYDLNLHGDLLALEPALRVLAAGGAFIDLHLPKEVSIDQMLLIDAALAGSGNEGLEVSARLFDLTGKKTRGLIKLIGQTSPTTTAPPAKTTCAGPGGDIGRAFQWLAAAVRLDAQGRIGTTELYEAYVAACAGDGNAPLPVQVFTFIVTDFGGVKGRTMASKHFDGISWSKP